MKIPILRLPYSDEDLEFVGEGISNVLKSGYLTMAGNVVRFETAFAEYIGTRYAVATNSGTSSLEIILRSIGVDGATVVLPSNTFMATATAVVHAGGRVVLADCEEANLQMDPDDLRRKIRPDTKAVILVHIGGIISPRLQEIQSICDENQLLLVEDAAHAHGATVEDRNAGNLGVAGSFSFYPTKVMNTAEGGMITTNDEEIYHKSIVLRDHGRDDPDLNVHTEFGSNWRFSELHAVLGLQQMRNIDSVLEERRKTAAAYDEQLKDIGNIRPLRVPASVQSSYYKYPVFLGEGIEREALKREMKDRFSIHLPGEVYSHPLHSQPVFRKYPWAIANSPDDTFPHTEYVCRHHVCLPLYSGLTREETDYVADSLRRVLR